MGKKKRKRERSLSNESEDEYKKKKSKSTKKKKKEKKQKRHRSPSSCSTDDSSSMTSSSEDRRIRKKKKKDKKKKIKGVKQTQEIIDDVDEMVGPSVPADLPKTEPGRPKMAPMTKEEWDKRQSVVRRVYDEATGRHRLIKGDGEVLEEIVSRDRHKEINRQATAGDGMYFQSKLPQR